MYYFMEKDFGDFEEVTSGVPVSPGSEDAFFSRIRIPRRNEILGIVVQRLGGNRMEVKCSDGKIRNCRVPGRFKRSMWLRLRDYVLIEAWPDDNSKGDIVYQYKKGSENHLRKKGLLDNFKDAF